MKFQCAVAGYPDPYSNWEKNGVIVTPNHKTRISELDDLRVLEIKEVTKEDSGTYKIILENEVGRIEASARLDVVAKRNYHTLTTRTRARSLSPRVSSYSRSLIGTTGLYGSRTRLQCDIRTIPTPYLKWYHDGIPVEDGQKYQISSNTNKAILDIQEVTEHDAGVYKCVVSNETEFNFRLEVIGGVELLEALPNQLEVPEGENLQLRARVNVKQDLDVVWMKDGCVLPDCDEFEQFIGEDGDVELKIKSCEGSHGGDYRCEVYTPFGDVMSKCRVKVGGEFKNLVLDFSL